jgi:putative membrane protein
LKWGTAALIAVVMTAAVAAATGRARQAVDPPLSGLDRHFLVATDQENWFEYTAAQMATRRSPTQFGRQLGDIVAADHLELEARLNLVAGRLHVPLPRRFTAVDHWALHKLGTLSGQAFDRAYAQLVMAHLSVATANVHEELRYGTNRAVQTLARQLLPTLQLHQRLANELAGSSR